MIDWLIDTQHSHMIAILYIIITFLIFLQQRKEGMKPWLQGRLALSKQTSRFELPMDVKLLEGNLYGYHDIFLWVSLTPSSVTLIINVVVMKFNFNFLRNDTNGVFDKVLYHKVSCLFISSEACLFIIKLWNCSTATQFSRSDEMNDVLTWSWFQRKEWSSQLNSIQRNCTKKKNKKKKAWKNLALIWVLMLQSFQVGKW